MSRIQTPQALFLVLLNRFSRVVYTPPPVRYLGLGVGVRLFCYHPSRRQWQQPLNNTRFKEWRKRSRHVHRTDGASMKKSGSKHRVVRCTIDSEVRVSLTATLFLRFWHYPPSSLCLAAVGFQRAPSFVARRRRLSLNFAAQLAGSALLFPPGSPSACQRLGRSCLSRSAS